FGDSAFFHTAIPALINSVYQKTPVFMVVLDNAATVTSGFQPNPGSGLDIRGRSVDRLSIEGIAAACGVDVVSTVGPDFSDNELREAFRQGLESIEIALLVVRQRCEPASEK
ncbi:MAG: thiamine pyrophosphate-dependent enzyme, partial [Planctomycetes bacterium]|nr:thiamine pyrophosphate-dependent enzyme [Planctomycetota bacterium]